MNFGFAAHKGLGLACVPLPEDYASSREPRPTVKSTSEIPSPRAPISVLRTSARQEPPIESCDGPGRRREARRRRRQGVDFHSNTQFSMILKPGFAFNDPENVGSSVKEIVQEPPNSEDDASLECSPMEGRSPREAAGGCDNTHGSRESCAPLAHPGDVRREFGLATEASYVNTNFPLDELSPLLEKPQDPVPPEPQRSPSLHSAPQGSPFDHGPLSHLNSSVSSLRLEPTKMQVASCPWHSLSANELLSPNAEFTGANTDDQYEHNDFECSGELRSAFDSDTDHEDEASSSPHHRRYIMGSPRRNYGRDNSNHLRSPSGKFRRFRNALRGSISVGNLNGKNRSKGVIPPDTVPGTLGMPTDISVSGEVRQESRIQPPSHPFHAHTTSTSSTVATLPAGLATFSTPDCGPRPDAGKIGGKGVTTPVDADEVLLLGFQQERCKSELRLATSLIDHSGSGSPGTSAHPRSSSIPELPESCCQSAKVLISGQSPATNSPSELGSPPDIPLPPTPPLPPPLSLPSIMHFPHLPKLLPYPYLSSSPVKTLAHDDDPFYGDSRDIVDIGGGCRLTFVDPEESMAMLELSMAKLHMYAPDGSLRKSANLQDWVQIVVKEVQGADEAQDDGEPTQQELPHQRQPAVSLTPSTFARLELCAPIAIPPLDHPKDGINASPPSGKHHGRQPSLTLLPLFDFEKPKRPIKWSCAKHSKLARRTSSLINLQDTRVHSHGISPGSPSSSSGSSSMTDLPGSNTSSESVHSDSPVGPRLEPAEGTPSKTVPFLLRPVRHDRLHAHPKHSLSAPNSPTKNTRQYNYSNDHSNLLDEDAETETITPSSLSHSFSPSLLADSSEHLPHLHYNFLLHDYHKSDRSSKVRKLWERVGVRTERSVRSLRGSFAAHG